MSNISQIFGKYNGIAIRWNEDPNFPVWVGKDIGDALGVQNVRQVIREFDEDEKGVTTINTPGGPQEMTGVTEPGLYRLILRRSSYIIRF